MRDVHLALIAAVKRQMYLLSPNMHPSTLVHSVGQESSDFKLSRSDNMLHTNVTEHAKTYWDFSTVLAPNKERMLAFSVDYSKLNDYKISHL